METNNNNNNKQEKLYQVQPPLPKKDIIIGELWKPLALEDYREFYQISNYGRVYNNKSRKLVKQRPDRRGYFIADLRLNKDARKTIRTHRYVLLTFLPREDAETLETNHKDANKENNKLSNLEWVTPQENVSHAVSLGIYKNARKFTNEEITLIRETRGKFYKLAQKFNTSAQVISAIKRGLTHKTSNETN